MRLKAWFLVIVVAFLWAVPTSAQQAVHVKIEAGAAKFDLPARLYRPAITPAPAVAIFHGCGGGGAHKTRMAEPLKSWGYVWLWGDTFAPPAPPDRCRP